MILNGRQKSTEAARTLYLFFKLSVIDNQSRYMLVNVNFIGLRSKNLFTCCIRHNFTAIPFLLIWTTFGKNAWQNQIKIVSRLVFLT